MKAKATAKPDRQDKLLVIPIGELDPRPASEMRVGVDQEAVKEYAENFGNLPKIHVVRDSAGINWVTDGRHRLEGAILRGETELECRVTEGSYLDAFRLACRANAARGLRITNADKRRRVANALARPELTRWSNRRIAELCDVDEGTIRKHRAVATAEIPQLERPDKRVGKDGRARTFGYSDDDLKDAAAAFRAKLASFNDDVGATHAADEIDVLSPKSDSDAEPSLPHRHLEAEAVEQESGPSLDSEIARSGVNAQDTFDIDSACQRIELRIRNQWHEVPDHKRLDFLERLASVLQSMVAIERGKAPATPQERSSSRKPRS